MEKLEYKNERAWDQQRSVKLLFYRSIQNSISPRWNSGGIPVYPRALTSMMVDYHLVANLLNLEKKHPFEND